MARMKAVELSREDMEKAMNRRTGFQINLSIREKERLKAAAGEQPLAEWIRECALRAADAK